MKQHRDKTPVKRQALIERTSRVLSLPESEAEQLLATPRKQGLRVNTLKADGSVLDELRAHGWRGQAYDWAPDCYSIDAGLEAVRDSELFASGRVYIQNAASWLPVIALDPKAGERILDIAAAPGGKASHIAAITNNRAELCVNDNSKTRLQKMRKNFDRLNVDAENALFDARFLSKRLNPESFDKILLDAPCSGEGLIDINEPKTLEMWSVAAIKRLQSLQRKLLGEAWKLLKPGGTITYSTCTMAPEENEQVIDRLLRRRPEAKAEHISFDADARVPALQSWNDRPISMQLQNAVRLQPTGEYEAFFTCKLRKIDNPL